MLAGGGDQCGQEVVIRAYWSELQQRSSSKGAQAKELKQRSSRKGAQAKEHK